MGTPRRATSMVRDIVRHGTVAPSVVLVHPSYCLQCIAPLQVSRLNSSLTMQYLRTNLSDPASNAQLPTPPPQITCERNCGSHNHCTTSTRFLQLMMIYEFSSEGPQPEQVTQDTEAAKQEAESNATRLQASLRMMEVQVKGLEAQLEQKYLRTNLSDPASNAQLPPPPPQIIGERNSRSYNHCPTSTRILQLTMIMMAKVSSLFHKPASLIPQPRQLISEASFDHQCHDRI
ncbi:hypothetical protein T265_11958 [Opisthorchis viverrini]|uniref:Uncharacterized protein n=1 Tax=Opisthorchis viverrini TaxID=6198 RepID=A0A074YX19_OPIVI|nr:hypothetical protein T265_11958 [Opisthorchis viverrini]KER19178.1 hypothetical protein T265_11958 [Opisthorchis viverrini]